MKEKPAMLYASPFPPLHSGISDYSVILVKALSKYFEITLFIDDYTISSECGLSDYCVKRYGIDKIEFKDYDYLIYNMGNNSNFHGYIYETCLMHPGLVILHDYVLFHFFIGYHKTIGNLYSSLYKLYGKERFLKLKNELRKEDIRNPCILNNIAHNYPLNIELFSFDNKIMVHSEYTKQLLPKNLKSRKINLIQQIGEIKSFDKNELLEMYNIPKGSYIIASFGSIGATKLNDVACRVIKRLWKKYKNVVYLMVGDGNFVDEFIDGFSIIKTGYVSLNNFDNYIFACDLILNLRYPSMGETSATLVRALQLGKCCIINNDGWFHEIPDECAIKIGVDNVEFELEKTIVKCFSDKENCDKIGENAKNYISRDYNPEIIAVQIKNFLEE